ncbi:FAD-dependent oxidoreductase [Archaeoglobales archaeon ex4484_92]|nr:MAG: FAD-dependent oxidoreductase [Archaeoglobales archaeon ex4484_92]
MNVSVIGGGLAGLSVGYHLKKRSINSTIFEAQDYVGGLLRSVKIDGWTFDSGGSHIIFSKSKDILNEILAVIGDFIEHRRRTYIFYKKRYIEYPFENGMYSLDRNERYEILKDFVRNLMMKKDDPKNLLDWFYYSFGEAITEKYLRPYNEKIWKRDLRKISIDWVGRIPKPPIDDILRSSVGIKTEGYKHQLKFYYPLKGGIETFARNLVKDLNVKLSFPVRSLKFEDNKIIINNKYICDKLIYTAPLKEIGNYIKLDREIKDEIKKLDYNSLTVVGLAIRGRVPNFHWIYIPDPDIVFHRIAFISNYSPYMAPNGCSTVIAEISHKNKIKEVEDEVISGLKRLGFDFNIEFSRSWTWKYAYVILNSEYNKIMEKIRNYLMEREIIPFGRFGNWEYLNMDQVWVAAKELVSAIA